MYDYIIPFIVVSMVLSAIYILLRGTMKQSGNARVEIIIDADSSPEEAEELVITAKAIAGKYFVNADVYIRGGDEKMAETLCRAYNILRK